MICRESGCSLSNSHGVYLSLVSGCGCWLQNAKAQHDTGASIIPAGRPEQDRPARPRGQRMARGRSCLAWEASANVGSSHHVSPERKTRLMAVLRLAPSQPRLGRQFPL